MTSRAKIAFGAAMLAAGGGAFAAPAEKSTVCTITVNSADEREAFRRYLPEDRYEFVELVEHGRADWLRSACAKAIQCDVLIVSGHFAGTEFYSSRFDVNESLRIDEMQRVQCSESCPGLFSKLKEVYLFGCDTLKPEPVKSAAPEVVRGLARAGLARPEAERLARELSGRNAEASRDLMRRLFPNVPVIYGFSSLAPYGRTAGPMLARYFESGAGEEIGNGYASARLLDLFGPTSMTVTAGVRESDVDYEYRGESCRYYDERVTSAQKVAFMHRTLGGKMPDVRMAFDRVEAFFADASPAERRDAEFVRALHALERDHAARGRYLAVVRDTDDPALRVRMIAVARTVGWLSPVAQRAEIVRMILDVLGTPTMGYPEVDLICELNKDRSLDPELHRLKTSRLAAHKTAYEAARACMGSADARARVLRALASPREDDVQVAQAYLRHRPITDERELRSVARGVARMTQTGAQVRALETLARHHIADRDILDELSRLYAQASSVAVQRAIAEIFIRADDRAFDAPGLADLLRRHRLQGEEGKDLIDVLIGRLEAGRGTS